MRRRALSRGDIELNPTTGLEIPAVRSRRLRFATPYEAHLLSEAAPPENRVLWATAFYAGLRRGELRALRWSDVDLAGGVLRVERSWDVKEGVIEPKSFAGRRKVPIAAVRDYSCLTEWSDSTALSSAGATVLHSPRSASACGQTRPGSRPACAPYP